MQDGFACASVFFSIYVDTSEKSNLIQFHQEHSYMCTLCVLESIFGLFVFSVVGLCLIFLGTIVHFCVWLHNTVCMILQAEVRLRFHYHFAVAVTALLLLFIFKMEHTHI